MSGRYVDQNWEMLAEDLERRQWDNSQIEGMHSLIKHSPTMSSEGVSVILDYINQSDYIARMRNDNEGYQKLCKHLEEREWSEVAIVNFTHKAALIGMYGLMGVLELMKYQEEVDATIQAQKDHDRVFTYDLPDKEGEALPPREKLEITEERQKGFDKLQYDDMGNYINPPPKSDGRWDVC